MDFSRGNTVLRFYFVALLKRPQSSLNTSQALYLSFSLLPMQGKAFCRDIQTHTHVHIYLCVHIDLTAPVDGPTKRVPQRWGE